MHCWCWDHPRGCGEHARLTDRVILRYGSSPRMRGALWAREAELCGHGIIPADAGSTSFADQVGWCPEDHPRGCGEHFGTSRGGGSHKGSSPRMRGAPPSSSIINVAVRIIPADAGSTSYHGPSRQSPGDHPRGCGEHLGIYDLLLDAQGSSPRMRGAPTQFMTLIAPTRIIPADAGSTL